MSRSIKDYLTLTLKGIAMGAAEYIPGFSGATIAFITGLYKEIVDSVNQLNFRGLKILLKSGGKPFWKHINGNFMLSLSIGIFISFFTLGRLFSYLSIEYPIFIWSFLFGVIVASTVYVFREYQEWSYKTIFANLFGLGIALLVNILMPLKMQKDSEYWLVLLCGIVASFAMYLPGISATLILILLGQYEYILKSFSSLKFDFIVVYLSGCFFGFLFLSRFFAWFINKFRNISISILTGFMIGSLFKLWPWKHTLLSHTNQFAQIIPVKQENVLPEAYYDLTGRDPLTLYAILMAITGFLVIYLLHNTFSKPKQQIEI